MSLLASDCVKLSPLTRLLRIQENILATLEEAAIGSPEKAPDPVESEMWAQALIPVLQCLKALGHDTTEEALAKVTHTLPPNVKAFTQNPTPPPPPPTPTEADFDHLALGPGLK